jgi:hypothetical protein
VGCLKSAKIYKKKGIKNWPRLSMYTPGIEKKLYMCPPTIKFLTPVATWFGQNTWKVVKPLKYVFCYLTGRCPLNKSKKFAEMLRNIRPIDWYHSHSPSLVILKEHGNEADFLVFCRNWFLIDPLHYNSSRSDFGFKFVEIFVIEKRNPRKSASLPCPFNLSAYKYT